MMSKLCCIIIAIISIPLTSCGGNGSSSNSYGSTSDYPSTTGYNEPTQPQYYPCPECNSTGYMEDYSGNNYPCVKCGGKGMIKIGGGSQTSFTGHLGCKRCSCSGFHSSSLARYCTTCTEDGHTYEDHCGPAETQR